MEPDQHPLSGTHPSMPGEWCSFFNPSHLQVASSLWCVLNISKRTMVSLHSLLVWSHEDAIVSDPGAAGIRELECYKEVLVLSP